MAVADVPTVACDDDDDNDDDDDGEEEEVNIWSSSASRVARDGTDVSRYPVKDISGPEMDHSASEMGTAWDTSTKPRSPTGTPRWDL